MSTTVITGAAGFVGSHLCDRFLAEGHRVVGFDNLVTGRLNNLDHLGRDPNFHLEIRDVTRGVDLTGPVDVVLHFASPASPKDFDPLQIEILACGADGTRHALELARRKGAVFVLASTSEVYGDPEVHPQPEWYRGNVDMLTARGCYDESKRFAEAATMAWRRCRAVDARIVRIFNTYGPQMRLDDGRVLPNFLTQALRGEPITLYGDGAQTRSFTYVDDLVDGVWRMATTPGIEGPVNLGNPEEVSIAAAAREILALTGSRSTLTFRPLPVGDPRVRQPDITRARELLGWEPLVPRALGFRVTCDEVRARLTPTSLAGARAVA